MKKLLFSILFFFLVSLISAQDFQVTNTGISSVDIPALDVYGGNIYLAFGTNYWFYKFPDSGPSSPIDTPILPNPDAWGPYNVTVGVNKIDGTVYSSYIDPIFSPTTKYQLNFVSSPDGGDTWQTMPVFDDIVNGNSISTRYDMPILLCSENGNYYNIWFDFTTDSDTAAIYIKRNNGNKSRIDLPDLGDFEQAVSAEVVSSTDKDDVYITYGVNGKFYLKRMFFYNLTSGIGDTVLIKDLGNVFFQYDNFSKIIVDSNNNLNFFYNYFNSGGTYLTKSTDDGATWSDAVKIYSSPNQFENPYLSINITPDNIFVMVMHLFDGNIYVRSSSDGINWTASTKVNSTEGSVTDDSFLNSKVIDNGHIATAWVDNRTGNEEIFYSNVAIPDPPTAIKENLAGNPVEFNLQQNYPNPFNPATTIKFSIPKAGQVTLRVYNILGKQVAELVNTEMSAGNKTVNFDASNLSSGIYFYKLSTGNFVDIKKMVLLQ